jgi:hypothetical protein
MSVSKFLPMLLATAFALAGCGGGDGYGVASTPPPPTTPAAPAGPPIIPAAATSQQFSLAGASTVTDQQAPLHDAADQLQVRYVSASNSYEVQLPHNQAWTAISFVDSAEMIIYGSGVDNPIRLFISPSSQELYQHSRLFLWDAGNAGRGYEAIGIATPQGGVPLTGNANFAGEIMGFTSERLHQPDDTDLRFLGSIALSFNFASGTLSGNISPYVYRGVQYPLGTIPFSDTVFSAGSTTFFGKFDTNVAGLNSFSGLFTGPNAQELIGNFALPYKSPIDGLTYQADGAFVGKK